jgi:RNA polymerase sigma-70 factor (ECF subfamily)
MRVVPRSTVPIRLVPKAPEDLFDDAELVRAFSAGETWAAGVIWNRYAPMVYRLLERAMGPSGEAEDLTQEVFLRIFSKMKTLRDATALRAFIYSSAIRMLKWQLRRKRVRRILRLSDTGQLPEHPAASADWEARQFLVRFYGVLDRLRADDRTAFVLKYLEGLRLDEMAVAMGASIATVKRRISRASKEVTRLVDEDVELAAYFRQLGGFDVSE